ncbi:flagellar biosynthesis protein FliZ [Bacillus sp. B1-b2]|nr:flagellar biosynthesis protein FliZ [Bacillus sp. B1-b2]
MLHNDSAEENKETTDENQSETNDGTANNNEEEEQTDSQDTTNSVGVTIWDFIKMIFATIFVVFLIYYILRFINKRNHAYKSSQIIENIGGTTLGANRSIQIIKVGKRLLVVGVGESIQLIKEIEDEEEYRDILEDYNKKLDQLVQPSDIVTKVKNVVKNNHVVTRQKESFSDRLREQLKEVSNERKKKMDVLSKKGSSDKNE